MTFKRILNIATILLVALILYLAREELFRAWELLFQVNIWILALLIPLQLISYYAVGEMIFSYINQKKKLDASRLDLAKMALELNFVNHILPSGGVSGASYMTWRLGHFGVSAGRATLAQVVRFGASFAAFLALLGVALLMITADGSITRQTILITGALGTGIILGIIGVIYLFNSERRLNKFIRWMARVVNRLARLVRKKSLGPILREDTIKNFFIDMRGDYLLLKKEPGLLIKPFKWGILFNLAEISMFWVAFLALGEVVNPAPLLIAYGLATIAGLIFVTPGGAGGYELFMIGFLTTAGIDAGATVAAVVLTRTILILGTIVTGYIFYHQALKRHGKHPVHDEPAV